MTSDAAVERGMLTDLASMEDSCEPEGDKEKYRRGGGVLDDLGGGHQSLFPCVVPRSAVTLTPQQEQSPVLQVRAEVQPVRLCDWDQHQSETRHKYRCNCLKKISEYPA